MKRSTAALYRQIVNKHLRPAFGAVRSDRLTPAMIAEWRAQQPAPIGAGEATPSSFNFRFSILQAVLKWARRSAQRHLAHDPLMDAKRVQARQVERPCLTLEDIQDPAGAGNGAR